MRKQITKGCASVAWVAFMACAGSAQAAMVNFTLSGTVDGSFGGPYGLNAGDAITASGSFDDAALASGYVYFDMSSGNALSIQAGSLSLDQTMDDYYASGGSPRLEFDGLGNLIGFNFYSLSFTSGALDFYMEDLDFNVATGSWNAESFSMAAPVPVPAAVWLLGSGLVGLASIARRRKSATA